MEPYDVLVVGGGPAGLSAALVLGRCRRRVCLVDAGAPRNAKAQAAHGVFTRDGTPPHELLRLGREQLVPYGVDVHDDEVTTVCREENGFQATTRGGLTLRASKLLLATGMRDRLPDRPGFRELFGTSVHVCPYCDGWENRDKRLAAYAPAAAGAELALALLTWSDDVTLVTPGEALSADDAQLLARNGVAVHADDVESLELAGDRLAALVLRSGTRIERDALFVKLGEEQAAGFVTQLGCSLTESGTVRPRDGERGGPPGLFVAGDASHDLQLVSIAVAEGVKAACAINTELRKEAQR